MIVITWPGSREHTAWGMCRLATESDVKPEAAHPFWATGFGEASMMARCTDKTNLHNVEPEDLSAVTIAKAAASDISLVGKQE